MPLTCYATVSDLALCQRCPALFAYKIHMRKKSAWRVGIHGGGEAYGSIFHREISEKFFNAASDSRSPLHKKILSAASGGADSLEECVRENFFAPFVEKRSERLSSGQILSMAQAVRVWVRRMAAFLEDCEPVFLKPEGKLQGCYRSEEHEAELIINGRYDAMIFNPGRHEVRLFEFKGFKKSDVVVPLSQSLIYSWLVKKSSGIIPSIEIIYLDEEEPEIFEARVVREMIISGLPGLFGTALDIILLRRIPEMLHDENLCSQCKFTAKCKGDMKKIFSLRRRGVSLLSVAVFLFAATMITAQVFFFTTMSAETASDERDILRARLQLANIVEEVKGTLASHSGGSASWEDFDDLAQDERTYGSDTYSKYYDLDYTYVSKDLEYNEWSKIDAPAKLFPPMEDHYLIRAYKERTNGKNLMLQVLVTSDGKIKSYEEIWYKKNDE